MAINFKSHIALHSDIATNPSKAKESFSTKNRIIASNVIRNTMAATISDLNECDFLALHTYELEGEQMATER